MLFSTKKIYFYTATLLQSYIPKYISEIFEFISFIFFFACSYENDKVFHLDSKTLVSIFKFQREIFFLSIWRGFISKVLKNFTCMQFVMNVFDLWTLYTKWQWCCLEKKIEMGCRQCFCSLQMHRVFMVHYVSVRKFVYNRGGWLYPKLIPLVDKQIIHTDKIFYMLKVEKWVLRAFC